LTHAKTGGADDGAPPARHRGFALLIVLWALVLVAFVIAHVTATGRTELRIASNVAAAAAAQAAADGAIFHAIYKLSDPRPQTRWPLDGDVREVRVGNIRVVVRLEDEDARINPNTASQVLLEALLQKTGSDPDTAQRLGGAIEDWVGNSNSDFHQRDDIDAAYKAAGLNYTPPGKALESLDELGRVLGMTPQVLAAIRPYLTLYSDQGPEPEHADPVVASALALAERLTPVPSSVPNLDIPINDTKTARITAVAYGPGSAEVRTVAVVRVGNGEPDGYEVLARDGGLD
jgi:general secretion pathway protein K